MKRWDHVTFISAGAGSGKTYRLTEELEKALLEGKTTPAGIIGTTFTVKAATELRERVRDRLLRRGHPDLAERAAESLIGTVHSVCERLLRRFAFELGLSPQLNVMSTEDGIKFFNQALDQEVDLPRLREMNALCSRLDVPQWQGAVKNLADMARENDIDPNELREMGERNAAVLLDFFGEPLASELTGELQRRIEAAAAMPADGTRKTENYRQSLVDARVSLSRRDCPWPVWMRLAGTEAAGNRWHIPPAFRRRRSSTNAIPPSSATCVGSCAACTASPPIAWRASRS